MKKSLRSFMMGIVLFFAVAFVLVPVKAHATPIQITTLEELKDAAAHPEYSYELNCLHLVWPSEQTTVAIPGNVELKSIVRVPANITLTFPKNPYFLYRKVLVNSGKLMKSDGKSKASFFCIKSRLEGTYDLDALEDSGGNYLKGTFRINTLKIGDDSTVLNGTFNLDTLDVRHSFTIPAGTTVRTKKLVDHYYNIKVQGKLIVTGSLDVGINDWVTTSGSGKVTLPGPVLTVKTEKETENLFRDKNNDNTHRESLVLQTRNLGKIYVNKNSFKLITLKSSNTKVLTVSKITDYDGGIAYNVTLKKTGKATVTVKLRHLYSGKTITYKKVYTVKKYVNPFKTLKIGKTSLASGFSGGEIGSQGARLSGKLQIAVKNGWKLSEIQFQPATGSSRKVKVGQKVTLTKGSMLYIRLTKKGWRNLWYCLYTYN